MAFKPEMANKDIPPDPFSGRQNTYETVTSPGGQSSVFEIGDERPKASIQSAEYPYRMNNISKDDSSCPNNYNWSHTGEKYESVLVQN